MSERTDHRMVCKHCGGEDFYADVEIRATAWIDSSGVWVGSDGKPHIELDDRVQDVETWRSDYDIDRYVCNGCRKGSSRLGDLVIPAPAPDSAPVAPCGRCDHGRYEHPECGHRRSHLNDVLYERGPMPCQHEGCDCHDYYDVEIANAGQPADVLAAVGRAA